ncbi:HAMP domain-containing histidine kinase [Microbacterium sp. EYE_512]|uniref:histidine kinase n=1 Tax=Microbacterium wangchenii TaxID=2541726 RepID=A0ABX5SSG1_9MICO|nr:HAMP domain-containing histidine kinase [Microbacterium sp. EYE_512]QBR89100.1 HAMP domain-containing histidine kinase [Microbacterium wangchenii]TXK20820.1 HAMP domain-containing histidine kinase [Microbacterium wangchenii]
MLRSVRARTTAGATAVVAVALIIGAFAFFGVLTASVFESAERAAENRAEELAARIEDDSAQFISTLDEEVVQVLDANGEVIASGGDAGSEPLPTGKAPGVVRVDGEPVFLVTEDLPGGRVLALGVSVEDETETLGTVALLLTAAVPVLVALVAATTWIVVGRALRPVERIRADVDGITAERLDRRVPVPDSQDEIAHLTRTMNGMLDRLDASAQAQRRFVSDASHELRSPLATIRQHAEIAQTHPDTTSVGELADLVHEEGLRMQGLVDALLLLTRLDEGAAPPHETVDLDDLVLAEVRRLRQSGRTVDGSGIGAARVAGDPRLLGQLVRNLADNAARHARNRIAFTVGEHAGTVVLEVEDDGSGIPEAERERVFERFVRLDEARARDAGGSGLGLAIVRAIAAASGGSVSVAESRWGGARFVVRLPAAT